MTERVHDVGERAHDLGEKAKEASRTMAEATVDVSKEATAALLWLAAAFAAIVYVLLKPERREQLTRFAADASLQAREVWRDLKGYDDEF